jgi:nicotinamidase-related amidase
LPLIDVTQSMLLVIDAQQDFYGATRIDVDRAGLDGTLRRAAWVAAVAGRLGVPVVVTEEDAATNGATADVIRAVLREDAPVLPKWTFGAPGNPDILAAIEATNATVAVLVGLETDVCVAHSALGLQDLGKRVVAVHDALFSPTAWAGWSGRGSSWSRRRNSPTTGCVRSRAYVSSSGPTRTSPILPDSPCERTGRCAT